MTGKPKILIVEDSEKYQSQYAYFLGAEFELLQATDLEIAEKLFYAHPDVALVVMDACVPGSEPNSVPLVKKIRESFSGPMIAASADPDYRETLIRAGCSHKSPKDKVPSLIRALIQ